MKLYFRDRVLPHVCLITQMTNRTYSVVLACHVSNTITTFVYKIWIYIWYQTVANKYMFHINAGNSYITAICF